MGGLILAGLSLMQFNPGKPLQAQAAAHRNRTVHADRIALGMAASAASIFMLSTMNVFAKLLSSHHSAIEVAFYRNLIAALPFAVWFLAPRASRPLEDLRPAGHACAALGDRHGEPGGNLQGVQRAADGGCPGLVFYLLAVRAGDGLSVLEGIRGALPLEPR